jgi:predicted permease
VTDDPIWQRYWRYLTARFRPEVRDEVEFHLAERARELQARGLPADAARIEAERRFGDPARVRARLEQLERSRGRRMKWSFGLGELGQDVRYGLRGLLKRPSFTLLTATSLALGIAVSTVVLTLVDSWLLRPLPVEHASRLVVIGAANRATGSLAISMISLPTIRDIAARNDLFEEAAGVQLTLAAFRPARAEQGQRRLVLAVTGNYFSTLGVSAAAGRFLDYRTWVRDFAADPSVIGSTVRLSTVPFVIVGVTPPSFRGTEHIMEPSGYVPSRSVAAFDPSIAGLDERRDLGGFKVIARRRPGVSLGAVRRGLDLLGSQLQSAYPELGEGYRLSALPESRARPTMEAGPGAAAAGIIFSGLALLVLLTAAVNATNLMLARGSTRQAELAVRQALGASRGRVVRQLLTETLLLALLGLAAAWFLARLAIGALTSIPIAVDLPMTWGITVDWRIFGLAVLLTLAVGLLAGAGPAVAISRFNLQQRLREGARTGLSRRGRRLRSALVVAQVAGSLVVLVFAGLFAASARHATKLDFGFDQHRLVTVGLDATLAHYDEPRARAAFDRVERAVQQLPGIEATAWSSSVPIRVGSGSTIVEVDAGETGQPARSGTLSMLNSAVGPRFFEVMGTPVLEGRSFLLTDNSAAARVAVVNQRAAELLWPGRSAIGRIIRVGRDGPPIEVVGVVKTGRYIFIGEAPRPHLYLPLAQQFSPRVSLFTRTRSDPALLLDPLRRAILTVDRDLVPSDLSTMGHMIETSANGMLMLRVGAAMASAIGALALILTCVGLYGVVAYSVAQRTREIGLRMALGADRWMVIRSVALQGAWLAGLGIAIGVAVALVATRPLAGLVIGVSVTDGAIFGGVAAALGLVALGAAYLPARRAARIDPVRALKAEEASGG